MVQECRLVQFSSTYNIPLYQDCPYGPDKQFRLKQRIFSSTAYFGVTGVTHVTSINIIWVDNVIFPLNWCDWLHFNGQTRLTWFGLIDILLVLYLFFNWSGLMACHGSEGQLRNKNMDKWANFVELMIVKFALWPQWHQFIFYESMGQMSDTCLTHNALVILRNDWCHQVWHSSFKDKLWSDHNFS